MTDALPNTPPWWPLGSRHNGQVMLKQYHHHKAVSLNRKYMLFPGDVYGEWTLSKLCILSNLPRVSCASCWFMNSFRGAASEECHTKFICLLVRTLVNWKPQRGILCFILYTVTEFAMDTRVIHSLCPTNTFHLWIRMVCDWFLHCYASPG